MLLLRGCCPLALLHKPPARVLCATRENGKASLQPWKSGRDAQDPGQISSARVLFRSNQRGKQVFRPSSVHLVYLLVLFLVVNSACLSLEHLLAVAVELEGSDHAVAWVNWDVGLLTVGLLLNDFLNVNASASAVDTLDLALVTLELADDNLDLVVLAHGEGTDLLLVAELLGKVAGHHNSADAAWGSEVGLS